MAFRIMKKFVTMEPQSLKLVTVEELIFLPFLIRIIVMFIEGRKLLAVNHPFMYMLLAATRKELSV